MKKIRILILFLFLFLQYSYQISAQENNAKSIAVVLKIIENKTQISSTEVSSFKIYNGIAKKLNKNIPVKTPDILKIKVLDEANNIIFSGFYENPLNQKLESFEENGAANNNILPSASGYINIRFPLTGNYQNLIINTYTVKNDKEILSSTLKFKIQ